MPTTGTEKDNARRIGKRGGRLRDVLADHAPALAAAADAADGSPQADACAVLAAIGYGETPPSDAVERARERAQEGDNGGE